MNEDEGVDDLYHLVVDLHRAEDVTVSVDENATLQVFGRSQRHNIRKVDWMGMMKVILSSPTLLSVDFVFKCDPSLCLSMVHEICQGLSSNHAIKSLGFSLRTEVDLSEPLSKLLTANSCCLENLNLHFGMWNWTLGGVDQLGLALGQNRTLKSLDVSFDSNVGASSERNEKLFGARGLGSNRTLQKLVLDGVEFGRESGLMEGILRNNPSLKKLSLIGCDFINWEGVAAALEVNATVVRLDLETRGDDDASIATMGGDDMFAFLMRNSTLKSLKLWGSWAPSRIRSLAAVLAKNPPLKTLAVTSVGKGSDVLADLLRALTTNKCLHTFQFCGFSDSFSNDALVEDTFDFLKQENPTLRRLRLWDCLHARGLDSLAIALKSDNAALVELDIGSNDFDEKSVLNLLDILRHKKCLEILKLDDCDGVAGAKVFKGIMDMLAANIWLKEVGLEQTPLERDGSASGVAATLKRNAEVYSEEHLEVLGVDDHDQLVVDLKRNAEVYSEEHLEVLGVDDHDQLVVDLKRNAEVYSEEHLEVLGVDDHDQLVVDLHHALHSSEGVRLGVRENATLLFLVGSQRYNIQKDDWMELMKGIISSPTLLSVDFVFNGDPSLCLSMAHEICQGLSSNHTIKSLGFSLRTEVDLSEPLSKLLTANSCCLENLNLRFWMWIWTLSGVDQLGLALGQNRTLKSLDVKFASDVGASFETNEKMFGARGLGSNRTLQKLVLDGVEFGRESGLMEGILRNNPSLQKLSLYGFGFINWEGVVAALEVNATVVSLALRTHSDNEAMGGGDMFALLMRYSTLESLGLWGSWGPSRIRSLAAVLAKNPPLKTLAIRSNDIGGDGLADLLRALTTNKCLHTFQFFANYDFFPDDALVEHTFDFLKQENPALRRLHLRCCLDAKDLDSLAIALKSDNAALVELDIGSNQFDEKSVLNLLDILRFKKCLEILKLDGCEGVAGDKVFKGIMDMLAANIWLKEVGLEKTPLERDGSVSRIAATLKRNAEVYSEEHLEVLKGMSISCPKTARIFLCGYPRAGKTTLQRKMQGFVISSQSVTSSKRRIPTSLFGFPKFLRHIGKRETVQQFEIERTRGIEVGTIQWGDMSLSVWDMAGHEDFHSFHELVIPNSSGGGSSCVFLLVCNPFWKNEGRTWRQKPLEVIEQELVYWLNFVSSNMMISTIYKPCVQVVFTHKDVGLEADECIPRLQNKLDDVRRRFDKVIDLCQPYHMVDVNSNKSLAPLVQALQGYLRKIQAQAPFVFDECVQTQRCIDDWIGRHPKEPLVKWDRFATICESVMTGVNTNNLQVLNKRLKAITATLHDTGHIMHFEDHDFVVLDPRWFCKDIVGPLFDYRGAMAFTEADGSTTKDLMEVRLKEIIKETSADIEDILSLLMKLELCFENKTKNKSSRIFLPSTLKDWEDKSFLGGRVLSWHSGEAFPEDLTYVGRRLKCKDEDCTVLTLGFFPRLQVYLEKFYSRRHNPRCTDYTLEKNLISFTTNGMKIFIEYSGRIGYYIDIMVQSTNTKDETIIFIHEDLVPKIRDLAANPVTGCQGIVLVEGILRSRVVKDLKMCKYRKNQVVMVEDLKQEVLSRCEWNYQHSWEDNPVCGLEGEFESAQDLLGINDWEDVGRRRNKDLDELKRRNSWLFKEDMELSKASDIMETQLRVERSNSGIAQAIEEIDSRQKHRHERIWSKLGKMQETQGKILKLLERQERMLVQFSGNIDALTTFSKHLQQKSVPRLVYFTEQESSKRHPSFEFMIGRTSHLHLLCENGGHVHIVEEQKGLLFTVQSHQQQLQTLLVCGLKVLTLLMKIGAHATTGVGAMVPDLAKLFMVPLDTPGVLDGQSSNSLDVLREEVFESVNNRDVPMSASDKAAATWLVNFLQPHKPRFDTLFGLHKVTYKDGGKVAWICQECCNLGEASKKLERL